MNSSYGKVMLDIKSTNLSNEDKNLISNKHVGGLILFSRNFKSHKQLQMLTQEIKSLGNYKVKINLHSEVQAKVNIKVISEENIS